MIVGIRYYDLAAVVIYERHMCISTTRWQRQIHSAMNDTTSFARHLKDAFAIVFVNVDNRIDWCQFYEMYGVRCGAVWCGVVCGAVRCVRGAVWCSVVWCVWVLCVWCGVVWCGVVWYGVVWCGVVWCV